MITRISAVAAFSAFALIAAACSAPSDEESTSTGENGISALSQSSVHVMKMHPPGVQRALQVGDVAGPAGANLKYYGGPVIANAKVYTVYWGSNVQFQDHINQFYPAILNSPHMDWLSEYNTPTQQIGRGSFGGAVVDTSAPSGTTVTDAQIQTEIEKLIDAGKLPPNDGNNLYMVYFPPGVKITGPQGAGTSCVEFCAYHGTFQKGGKYGYYGVMPDLGGACAQGCGDGSPQDNITEVSSHEMVEAITDGAVGLATSAGPPLAWYDNNNGEIGDICTGHGAQVAGFTVQLEWSNKIKKCTALGGGGSSSSSSGSSGNTSSSSSGGSSSGGSSSGGSSSGSTSGGSSSGGTTCKHDMCSAGAKLSASCDSCVAEVCAADSYCCKTKWDSTCVKEVASVCGHTCN